MARLTISADDNLFERVRQAAAEKGLSVNVYVSHVLDLATNLEYSTSSFDRVSELFRAAGLLAERSKEGEIPLRQKSGSAARKAVGRGTTLSENVAANRE